MKKISETKKQLSLGVQTLRTLRASDLIEVAGGRKADGGGGTTSCSCDL
jgi:hypothetical protein